MSFDKSDTLSGCRVSLLPDPQLPSALATKSMPLFGKNNRSFFNSVLVRLKRIFFQMLLAHLAPSPSTLRCIWTLLVRPRGIWWQIVLNVAVNRSQLPYATNRLVLLVSFVLQHPPQMRNNSLNSQEPDSLINNTYIQFRSIQKRLYKSSRKEFPYVYSFFLFKCVSKMDSCDQHCLKFILSSKSWRHFAETCNTLLLHNVNHHTNDDQDCGCASKCSTYNRSSIWAITASWGRRVGSWRSWRSRRRCYRLAG